MTSDGNMWVWIPRYAYQIESNYHTNNSTGGIINIKFMKGTSNTAFDGTNTWDNSIGEGNWNIHPGFEYDTTKTGIWVAKFEASNKNDKIKIRPNQIAWSINNIGNTYNICINYNSNLSSHMIKNSEWGAVAYLTQSIYGKNSAIWVNPDEKYITGRSGKTINSAVTRETYVYDNMQYGINASTTGNVYGIYDLCGGLQEWVAWVSDYPDLYKEVRDILENGPSYTRDYFYYNKSNMPENGLTYENAYGHALYETSSKSAWASERTSWYSGFGGVYLRSGNNYRVPYSWDSRHICIWLNKPEGTLTIIVHMQYIAARERELFYVYKET